MNANLTYPEPSPLSIIAVTIVANFIAIGLLTTVAFLFLRDGTPLEQLAAAERACIQHAYVSEREACMHEWLVFASASKVAVK